ncbi:hypothetical protein O6H91_01G078900 [Diphasiastrum complanatum]|uniref:Uncharacterized protein n=3 Tax=Diphasiastrum complanatum TaxID=34168 RepID=A0ACC2ESJ8_DIPCM|nr:hypothetical protein O6H91_01G078900 [Diphasiastrum complanatum]KAJ7569456.1 hypothetical protein O6H91_01G078900 [Diphasiastrum complanatum]
MMQRSIHPAQVETSSCYCAVDTGFTVTGARKLVAGAKHCTRPEIKPCTVVTKSRPKREVAPKSRPKSERNRTPSQLLPGLPDDLAIACLVRVPRCHHRKLRTVCKKWYRLLTGNYFYSLRKTLGIAEEWIYVMKRDKDGRISWHAFDPRYQLWQPLPPVPVEYCEAIGFGCAVLSGCHLYLFGGKDPVKGSTRRVVYYSARTNKWHRAPDMLRRRHFFGCCVINNCLYVAGGEGEVGQRLLRCAEVFDPNKNKWSYISEMTTAMVPFIGVVYEGKWFLKGLGSHRQVISEAFVPTANHWSPIMDGMVNGWRNPSTCLNGQLYALDCQDGCKLRVYDGASDSWSVSVDSRLHLGNSQALEAAALLPLGGKLCIIRNNMSITLVNMENANTPQTQLWDTIAGKGSFKSVVTNLLSGIAGRGRLKEHIVHCQVLQA